jgi:hypothetical protein
MKSSLLGCWSLVYSYSEFIYTCADNELTIWGTEIILSNSIDVYKPVLSKSYVGIWWAL